MLMDLEPKGLSVHVLGWMLTEIYGYVYMWKIGDSIAALTAFHNKSLFSIVCRFLRQNIFEEIAKAIMTNV